ncbi:hemin uptake protein HemP [Xanthobacter sp. KR7-225]|uniref:hemin uptake protein HemP n=1 Tax=Xanthobacter sp. KR7-225 TaxID=3156613 RepID=UPI0032B4D591
MTRPPSPPGRGAGTADAPARAIPVIDQRIDSADLFRAGRIVIIDHGGETYRLRLTAQNRLILTK